MKKIILIIVLLISGLNIFSQIDSFKVVQKRYVAWVSPSDATHVYGLMFNFFSKDRDLEHYIYPKIYGMEINLNILGAFSPFVLALHSFDPETHKPPSENIDNIDFSRFKKVNGIQCGLLNMENTVINGLDINTTGSFNSKVNGLTISLVMNKHYIINGITCAPIGNHDVKCNGIQIGLINSSKRLKGFQIGIWNKNQKRSLPIINWCFK